MTKARDYRKEWLTYDSLPKRKKARAARGRARYALMKEGKVKVGDCLLYTSPSPRDS